MSYYNLSIFFIQQLRNGIQFSRKCRFQACKQQQILIQRILVSVSDIKKSLKNTINYPKIKSRNSSQKTCKKSPQIIINRLQSQTSQNNNILTIKNMKSNKTSYIEHPLNKSPSKTAYTFSKSERFPDRLYGSSVQYQQGFSGVDPRYSKDRDYGGYYRENTDYSASAARQNNAGKENRSKSKSISKGKRSPNNNSKSPSRRVQFKQENDDQYYSRSPGRNARGSIQKRTKQSNQILNSRTGYYYPLGIQINKEGKYYVSNYQNVKSSKFSTMPRNFSSTSPSKIYDQQSELGPGSYEVSTRSPGKYITSQNRNNLSHRFSKSPRKGQGEDVYKNNPNFGPGMYRTFSQFGGHQ